MVDVVTERRVSYAPDPHLLLSIRRENLPWWKVLGELIDNALDHAAKRVIVTSSAKVIEVQDDGTGIKDLVSAIRLGSHVPSLTTSLGMYGVGHLSEPTSTALKRISAFGGCR